MTETLFTPGVTPGGPQPGSPVAPTSTPSPVPATLGATPEVLFRPEAKGRAPGFTESFSTAFALDSPVASVARLNEAGGIPMDPEFALTPDVQNEMTSDVPEQLHLGLLDTLTNASSQPHADILKDQFLAEVKREQLLTSAGMGGLAIRVLANIADPVNLALAFSTGGLGHLTKAGALRGALRVGAWTAAENAAIETAIVAGSHTRGVGDVVFSALGGFALGGGVGAAFARSGDNLAGAVNTTVLRQMDDASREALEESGLDSAGAKRVQGYTEPLLEREVAGMFDIDDAEDIPKSALGGVRLDAVGRLGQSDDPFVREAGRSLAEEGVGVEGHGVVKFGASERAAQVHRTVATEWRRQTDPAYGEWLNEMRAKWPSRVFGTDIKGEFFTEVTQAVRSGTHASPAVRKAADATRRTFSRYLDELKAAKVAGFEDIPQNARYVPRVFSHVNIRELVTRYGGDGMNKLVKAGLRGAAEDLDDAVVDTIAKGYVTRVRRMAAGMDSGLAHGINVDDVDFLTSMLRDTDLDEEAIEAVLLNVKKTQEKSSKLGRAKRRLDLDENVSVRLFNKDSGEEDLVNLTSIFENDAEKLLFGYSRQMSGWIGMAKQAGIRSPAEARKLLDVVKSRGEERGRDAARVQRDVDRIEFLIKGVTGVPLESDPASLFARSARTVRDINFLRVGAAFGFAQLAEVGNNLGTNGLRITLANMPSLRGMIKRGVDGKLENQLASDLEDMLAPGVDRLLNQASTRWEEHGFSGAGKGSIGKAVDNAMQVAKRATADVGGLNAATTVFQRMAASGIAQKLAGFAHGARLSDSQITRLKGMGLSDEMQQRIFTELRKRPTRPSFVPGGKKMISIDPHEWTDLDALDHFTMAVHREARRVVQENDIGSSTPWLHSTTGKLLTQFRTFSLTSWSKATLHGIHHRDMQAFNVLQYSMFMGGLAYIAQTSMTVADPKRREERLEIDEIAKAAFQRTAPASIVPMLVDTAATTVFRTDPLFAYGRSSGLATGAVGGVPTVDLVDKVARVAGIPAAILRSDQEVTRRDYRSATGLLPVFGGMVGMKRVLDALGESAFDIEE